MAVPDPGRPLSDAPTPRDLSTPEGAAPAHRNAVDGRRSARWAAPAQIAAALLVLYLTRALPGFAWLGRRGALFGWLASATAITALLPAIVTSSFSRLPLTRAGLTWGRARRDASWIALLLLGAIAIGAVVSRDPSMHAYYPRYAPVKEHPLWWLPSTLAFAAYGLSWEALFRGHLLLALHSEGDSSRRTAGLLALQTAIFAIGHLDKPLVEACLSVPAGLFFGALALRTRSILPGFLIHFAASTSVNLFCAYGHFSESNAGAP